MKHFVFLVLVATATLLPLSLDAASLDVLGVWTTENKDAKIEIYRCEDKYCGKIVWIAEPVYPQGSKEGLPGTPILDHNNPEPAKRNIPLCGLEIMHNFKYAGNNLWGKGALYDADKGKTYDGEMRFLSPRQLEVRGFIGISLLGSSTIWTKERSD